MSKNDNPEVDNALYFWCMSQETQLARYKKLLRFIEGNFKEDVSIPEIEEACHYSYRNINRIFEALNHETIGKYIKRVKLERAAQYLKYSDVNVSDIARELSYGDIASFSKAFKSMFNCSPSSFRNNARFVQKLSREAALELPHKANLSFEIEELPSFQILGLEYRGAYEDIKDIKKTWNQLVSYAAKKKLLQDDTMYLAEILDDDEITDQINCRYTAAIVLPDDSTFDPEGLFIKKTIESSRYAKFIHKGSDESSFETYQAIYGQWMADVPHEMADAPVLEFYLDDDANTPKNELRTEIYIPIEWTLSKIDKSHLRKQSFL